MTRHSQRNDKNDTLSDSVLFGLIVLASYLRNRDGEKHAEVGEDRNVSKRAMGNEMSALPRSQPRWPGFVALAALAISVIALWTGFAGPSKSEMQTVQAAQFTVRYHERGMSHSWGPVEKIIPIVGGFKETYEFSISSRDYKLHLKSKIDRTKTVNYEVEFCLMVENNCIDIHVPRLSVVPGQSRQMHTRSQSAIGPNDEFIRLNLSVSPRPVPP